MNTLFVLISGLGLAAAAPTRPAADPALSALAWPAQKGVFPIEEEVPEEPPPGPALRYVLPHTRLRVTMTDRFGISNSWFEGQGFYALVSPTIYFMAKVEESDFPVSYWRGIHSEKYLRSRGLKILNNNAITVAGAEAGCLEAELSDDFSSKYNYRVATLPRGERSIVVRMTIPEKNREKILDEALELLAGIDWAPDDSEPYGDLAMGFSPQLEIAQADPEWIFTQDGKLAEKPDARPWARIGYYATPEPIEDPEAFAKRTFSEFPDLLEPQILLFEALDIKVPLAPGERPQLGVERPSYTAYELHGVAKLPAEGESVSIYQAFIMESEERYHLLQGRVGDDSREALMLDFAAMARSMKPFSTN